MIKTTFGIDDDVNRMAAVLINGDVLGVLPDYLYAIAHSNLPVSDIFRFLLKHNIKGHRLHVLISDHYCKDLNLFIQALTDAMSTFKYDVGDDYDHVKRIVYDALIDLSPRYKQQPKQQKTNDELLQEILEIL